MGAYFMSTLRKSLVVSAMLSRALTLRTVREGAPRGSGVTPASPLVGMAWCGASCLGWCPPFWSSCWVLGTL